MTNNTAEKIAMSAASMARGLALASACFISVSAAGAQATYTLKATPKTVA